MALIVVPVPTVAPRSVAPVLSAALVLSAETPNVARVPNGVRGATQNGEGDRSVVADQILLDRRVLALNVVLAVTQIQADQLAVARPAVLVRFEADQLAVAPIHFQISVSR